MLLGIAVGNGFTDPLTMLAYSDLVYQFGLIDTNQYKEIQELEASMKQLILEEKYSEASAVSIGILLQLFLSPIFPPSSHSPVVFSFL